MQRRTVVLSTLTALAASSTVAFAAGAAAPPGAARSTRPAVPGTAPLLPAGGRDLGPAAGGVRSVTLVLALRDQPGLTALLAAPHAPLSPAAFTARFGPAVATVDAIRRWAATRGLGATVSPNRTLVTLSGPTAAVDRALGVRTHAFRVGATTLRAAEGTATLPGPLAGSVRAVVGLSDVAAARRAAPTTVRGVLPAAVPRGAAALTVPQTFDPHSLAAFYDAPAAATGAGQSVGVIAEGNLTGVLRDLRTFESTFGLPTAPVTVVGAGSADTAGADEYDLDTQYATGEAPSAALRVYDGASLANADVLATITSWVTDDVAKTASFSAGECESLAAVSGFTAGLDQTLAQAAAQGQTLFVSSGDNGAYCSAVVGVNGIPAGLPGVEYPASATHAIGVGGTTVTGDLGLGVYTGEVAWYAGGGGLSAFEARPAWQTATVPGVRGVPDVALDADPTTGYVVVVAGQRTVIGGTSASAPAWNGFWARALGARGALGYAGPRLYGAARTFHDVVVGSNGLYAATPGYDYTTGLGTPDVAKLIAAL